jgi:hypothetical protein
VLTQAVAWDWIDQPAVERRVQLEQRLSRYLPGRADHAPFAQPGAGDDLAPEQGVVVRSRAGPALSR